MDRRDTRAPTPNLDGMVGEPGACINDCLYLYRDDLGTKTGPVGFCFCPLNLEKGRSGQQKERIE